MKGSLLNRITKAKKSDVVHSSGYAKVQNSGIGSASTQSFETRRQIDKSRFFIKKYRDSRVVNEFGRKSWQSWQARRDAVQFNDDNKEKSMGNGVSKGGILQKEGSVSASTKPNIPDGARAPSQMPARKNPGISR